MGGDYYDDYDEEDIRDAYSRPGKTEIVDLCPLCGRDLEVKDGFLYCKKHGFFDYHCPQCGTLMQILTPGPAAYRCPNQACEVNCTLYTPVNNHALQLARLQFLQGLGRGPNRKKAREILRGDVKKTKNGKNIGDFGSAVPNKRYFDNKDIDAIFAVWEECLNRTRLPARRIPGTLATIPRVRYGDEETIDIDYEEVGPEALPPGPSYKALKDAEMKAIPPHVGEGPRPEPVPETKVIKGRGRCPHCSYKLKKILTPKELYPKDKVWQEIYKPVPEDARDDEYQHEWGFCPNCYKPFIIIES